MIGFLILGTTFLIILFVGIILIVVKNQQNNIKLFENLTTRIDETQNLFNEQVTKLLGNFKSVIDSIEKKNELDS